MQAWHDESDGTILGSLGYDKVLESPAVAYDELQAQLLAYAEEHAPDSEAQQVTCCTAGADPFIKRWQTAPSIVPNSISFVAFPRIWHVLFLLKVNLVSSAGHTFSVPCQARLH